MSRTNKLHVITVFVANSGQAQEAVERFQQLHDQFCAQPDVEMPQVTFATAPGNGSNYSLVAFIRYWS